MDPPESSIYEANLVTILPQEIIEKLAELDLELSEGKLNNQSS